MPLIARFDQSRMHIVDRANIEAAGRLHGDQQPRIAGYFPAKDELLLIAARQTADRQRSRLHSGFEIP